MELWDTCDIRANKILTASVVCIFFQMRLFTFLPAIEFLLDSGTNLNHPQEEHNLQKTMSC